MKGSTQLVVKAASGVAADYLMQCLDAIWSKVRDEFRQCTRDVQIIRQSAATCIQARVSPMSEWGRFSACGIGMSSGNNG